MSFNLQGDRSHGQSNAFCAALQAGHGVVQVLARMLLPGEREIWDEERGRAWEHQAALTTVTTGDQEIKNFGRFKLNKEHFF